MFILGANKYKHGKLIEDMKNDVMRKKIHSPKPLQKHVMYYPSGKTTTVANTTTTRVSNDGIAFATVMEKKERKKSDKKKDITCFR